MFVDDWTWPTGTDVKSMLPAWKASHSVEESVNSGMWTVSTNGPLVALLFHQFGFLDQVELLVVDPTSARTYGPVPTGCLIEGLEAFLHGRKPTGHTR